MARLHRAKYIGDSLVKRVFLYPISARRQENGSGNPYMTDLLGALSRHYTVVNREMPSTIGVAQVFRFLWRIDCVFLNWVENIPERRLGTIQTAVLLCLLALFKITGVEVVWTMHNKLSHSRLRLRSKRLLFRTLIKASRIVITHSSEGVEYARRVVKGEHRHIHYLPHPVKNRLTGGETAKDYDVLVWGRIEPYKGVLEFLEHLQATGRHLRYRILVAGSPTEQEYFERILKFASSQVAIKGERVPDNLLRHLISRSRIVLFPYASDSILSSGALMDSIGYGGRVVGPHVGAFADLQRLGIVRTFRGMDDLFDVIDSVLSSDDGRSDGLSAEAFITDNSWDRFGERVQRLVG